MAVDWLKIKTEYINGEITQRELAKKYGVTLRQISNHATAEKWVEEREQRRDIISTKVQQEAEQKIVDSESEVVAIKSRLKLKMFLQIEKRLGSVKDSDGQEFRRLVQNYKDMCDIRDTEATADKESPLAEMIRKWKDD